MESFNPEELATPPENSQKEVSEAKAEQIDSKKTSRRLLLAVEANLLPLVGKVNVVGKEHLNEIPPRRKVVIATSHISDLDIPLVIKALGKDFDLAVSDQSTHHSFSEDFAGKMTVMAAGEKNFLPIDWRNVDEGKQARFNPENFTAMSEAMDKGKDLIVAAHNPSANGQLTKGGVGGVYLSQLSDAIILPVAVNTHGEAILAGKNMAASVTKRPDVEVVIGKPIDPMRIEGIEKYKEILDKRKSGEKLSPDDVAQFKSLTEKLRRESDTVMTALAGMLPEEKRGPYNFKEEENT